MIYGVARSIGIDTAISNVCNCANARDNAIPLAVPINNEKNVPAQVGHAMNAPIIAPVPLIPVPCFENVYALTAIDVFNATRYDNNLQHKINWDYL